MAQYITTGSIFDIAVEEERKPRSPATMRLGEQEIIRFRNYGMKTEYLEVEKEYNPSINKHPIVTEPNCSVVTAQGWNTTAHKILVCHRGAEAIEKKDVITFNIMNMLIFLTIPFSCF